MALHYTYEDFEKALRASGLQDGFSDADLHLARANPEAGLQMIQYKQDWINASTDAEKTLAHARAEALRGRAGYSGGADGSKFYGLGDSGYLNTYSGISQKALEDLQGLTDGGYTAAAPTYDGAYRQAVDELLGEVLKKREFSYDPAADPAYRAYRQAAVREGSRSAEDTLAKAAASTGGVPSSYAATAAQQAQNYYNAQLSDKIPELYQMAYERYLREFEENLSKLSAAEDREKTEYARYLDALARYNTDRNYDLSLRKAKGDTLADILAAAEDMEAKEYKRFLEELERRSVASC